MQRPKLVASSAVRPNQLRVGVTQKKVEFDYLFSSRACPALSRAGAADRNRYGRLNVDHAAHNLMQKASPSGLLIAVRQLSSDHATQSGVKTPSALYYQLFFFFFSFHIYLQCGVFHTEMFAKNSFF